MEDLFDISNFNVIEDEENYYFFRALNIVKSSNIYQITDLYNKQLV